MFFTPIIFSLIFAIAVGYEFNNYPSYGSTTERPNEFNGGIGKEEGLNGKGPNDDEEEGNEEGKEEEGLGGDEDRFNGGKGQGDGRGLGHLIGRQQRGENEREINEGRVERDAGFGELNGGLNGKLNGKGSEGDSDNGQWGGNGDSDPLHGKEVNGELNRNNGIVPLGGLSGGEGRGIGRGNGRGIGRGNGRGIGEGLGGNIRGGEGQQRGEIQGGRPRREAGFPQEQGSTSTYTTLTN